MEEVAWGHSLPTGREYKALIEGLKSKIDSTDQQGDAEFAKLVSESMKLCRISTAEACVYFSLDIPTAERWRKGRTLIEPEARGPVLDFIRTRVDTLLSEL